MDDRDEFLEWFGTTWRAAEAALYDGDPAPRSATWSAQEPVSLFGASLSASGSTRVRDVFRTLAASYSDVTSCTIELVTAEVRGDLAYTAHREIIAMSVGGRPGEYVLRLTQVYRPRTAPGRSCAATATRSAGRRPHPEVPCCSGIAFDSGHGRKRGVEYRHG